MTIEDSCTLSAAPVAAAPGAIPLRQGFLRQGFLRQGFLRQGFLRHAVFVAALIGLADWLFYDHPIGISLAIFLMVLAAAAVAANPIVASRRELVAASAVLVLGLLPMAVQPGFFATLFGLIATAYVAIAAGETGSRWSKRLSESLRLLRDITWRVPFDVSAAVRLHAHRPKWSLLIGWIVSLALGAIFVLLLSSANPLIESFLPSAETFRLLTDIDVPRGLSWLLFACWVWPFIVIRRSASMKAVTSRLMASAPDAPSLDLPAGILDSAAILRSLLLFNALFAVETVLDLVYLWGGKILPVGISYVSYAHRGGYPLIVTALLAAAFVVIALKPGGAEERSHPIRLLVFAFIAQNVLLVSSSMLRLDLYVEVYSLSCWRLAAGIWMGLVAIGLVLIVVRIALGRSNLWLIGANAAALVTTLYAVSLVNLPAIIANYNVDHSREFTGRGEPLDFEYLASLGPHAIPALDLFQARVPDRFAATKVIGSRYYTRRNHLARMVDWRAWSYHDAVLTQYLTRTP